VAAAWILSAIFSTPMLVLYQEGVIEGQIQCWIDLPEEWHWKLYMTLVSVSLLVLPALLIFACYIVIVRTIWVQSGALTASVPTNTRTTSAGNRPHPFD
jgi:neuropeptide S receptor